MDANSTGNLMLFCYLLLFSQLAMAGVYPFALAETTVSSLFAGSLANFLTLVALGVGIISS